jgi:hypothetical protein
MSHLHADLLRVGELMVRGTYRQKRYFRIGISGVGHLTMKSLCLTVYRGCIQVDTFYSPCHPKLRERQHQPSQNTTRSNRIPLNILSIHLKKNHNLFGKYRTTFSTLVVIKLKKPVVFPSFL